MSRFSWDVLKMREALTDLSLIGNEPKWAGLVRIPRWGSIGAPNSHVGTWGLRRVLTWGHSQFSIILPNLTAEGEMDPVPCL